MASGSSDYARVEAALQFLAERRAEQPALDAVARAIGSSPFHLQRLFTRWAGVSPKRFLQFLTVEHAKRALRHSGSVLDSSLAAGLSGPGRLHDLFVAAEAVTPGEWKSGGAGRRVLHGVATSPFGDCFIAATERGICALSFVDGDADEALGELRRDWHGATLEADATAIRSLAARVFTPRRAADRPRVLLRGTNFQIKVWSALLRIPFGEVTTYEGLAAQAGVPRATRAVASAVARNQIAFLIPCHRVIRKTAQIGEYRWGAVRKQTLLGWEAARSRS